MNLPDSNFISAPLRLITLLHGLTLSLHFFAMNFLVGGLIVLLAGRLPNRWLDPTVRRFIKFFPTAMAATVTLGVAPLLFVQLVYSRQVYSAAIVSGWFWLMVAPAVILAYYLLYAAAFSGKEGGKGVGLTVALLSLLYVSLVYSSVFSMAERPDLMRELYTRNQAGLAWNSSVGEWGLRWLHMILGATTVGGFFVGLLSRDNPPAFETGKKFFLYGTVLSALVGFTYLFSLGPDIGPFMRSRGAWSLTVGILTSLGAVHFFFKKRFVGCTVVLVLSMLAMVANRHYVRLVRLQGHFDPASWRYQPQWPILLLFAACFVIALAVVWYMVRLFLRGKPENI